MKITRISKNYERETTTYPLKKLFSSKERSFSNKKKTERQKNTETEPVLSGKTIISKLHETSRLVIKFSTSFL